jgi:FtsZ-binding cell division protein ZapB
MDPAILVAIIGVLAAPFAALITWMLNRKKHIADIYTALSESSQTAVETMQLTMNELRTELEEARRKIDDLIAENELLRHDLHELKRQNQDLMNEIRGLRASYEK